MLVAGVVLVLLILGLFFEMLTMSPKPEPEWNIDTEEEFPTTPSAAANESTPIVA